MINNGGAAPINSTQEVSTMGKFIVIGERLSTTAPSVNKAFTARDPEPILLRAKQQFTLFRRLDIIDL